MKLSLQLHQQTWKPRLCENMFYVILKMQLLCGEGLLVKAYLQTLILKIKVIIINLKEDEGSKVEMIDGLMILEWGSALKNVKITGDTTSVA